MFLVPLNLQLNVGLPGFLVTPAQIQRLDAWVLPDVELAPVSSGPYPACPERGPAAVPPPSTVTPHAGADRPAHTASFFIR
eukprot:9372993-Heterocapsa_arctica.AAC.1